MRSWCVGKMSDHSSFRFQHCTDALLASLRAAPLSFPANLCRSALIWILKQVVNLSHLSFDAQSKSPFFCAQTAQHNSSILPGVGASANRTHHAVWRRFSEPGDGRWLSAPRSCACWGAAECFLHTHIVGFRRIWKYNCFANQVTRRKKAAQFKTRSNKALPI